MRFLSVAERELRAGARNKGMYRVRWIAAMAFFLLLLWLAWALNVFQNQRAGLAVFQTFSVLILLYCLVAGAAGTADCLSREKREGTLGLLFLTNLNSAEIIAGKWCSKALAAVYSLLAIFPVLALPVLIGGITAGHFWRTVLALLNALFFALAAGFAASALNVRQFPAVALAIGLALTVGTLLLGLAEAMRAFGFPNHVVETLAAFCPLKTLLAADDRRIVTRTHYWPSMAAVLSLSLTWLGLVAWRIGVTWRDRPERVHFWAPLSERIRQRGRRARMAMRRRWLGVNPFYWLAGRQRVSAPIFMLLALVIVGVTTWIVAPYLGRLIAPGVPMGVLAGGVFAWGLATVAIHALALYYAAHAASQPLSEDKQSGALELILSTPASVRAISRGLWYAYARRMLFPAVAGILAHFFFVWQCMNLAILVPPGELPAGTTPGQVLAAVFWNQTRNGVALDWHFVFMFRIVFLALAGTVVSWVTLGWVGRWLGLRMKHPGFAPIAAVAITLVPPVLLFSFICYLFDEWNMTHPEHRYLPILMWIGVGVFLGSCILLSSVAASRFRRDFRRLVISRFHPPRERPWWRPEKRTVMRFAVRAAATALVLFTLVTLLYGYQHWKSQRKWAAFQQQLRQRGESLELPAALPVPDELNFARTATFQSLLAQQSRGATTNRSVASLGGLLRNSRAADAALTTWTRQGFADFDWHLQWVTRRPFREKTPERADAAALILGELKRYCDELRAIAATAHMSHFQPASGSDAMSARTNQTGASVLEGLHLAFQWRAGALLAIGESAAAGEDVLTTLRLAQLARQTTDFRSSIRVQTMLTHSLQPIWEGIVEHRWTELQLAAFQDALAGFDLLSDHTNAVHRAVLTHIGQWLILADERAKRQGSDQGVSPRPSKREWRPKAWWYEDSIQLYQAGRKALGRVNSAAGWVRFTDDWDSLDGLPIDDVTRQLIQQGDWWSPSPRSVAYAQTAVNQAIIACALERHRLAHGEYPESLDALRPAYLTRIPTDILRGQPLLYERGEPGTYTLRGLGPNETNDSGKAASDDWVWAFPAITNAPPNAPAERAR